MRSLVVGLSVRWSVNRGMFVKKCPLKYQKLIKTTFLPTYETVVKVVTVVIVVAVVTVVTVVTEVNIFFFSFKKNFFTKENLKKK